MPIQRRLPKVGFTSLTAKYKAEVRLDALNNLGTTDIDLAVLKASNLIGEIIKVVKVVNSGELTKAVKLSGIKVTAGAKAAIVAAGGSVEE